MGKKKRRGYYCRGCDSYKPNESFSGKGYSNHLCKKCKAAGINRSPKKDEFSWSEQKRHNPFMKSLKIVEIIYVEAKEYVFFHLGGQLYVWLPEYESLILSINLKQEERLEIPDNLLKEENAADTNDALSTKRESRIMNGQYVSVKFLSEIIEIQEMGLITFEEMVHQVQVLEYENDEELDEYLNLETSFYPSEFQWELYEMDNKLKELILLLPHIEEIEHKYIEIFEEEDEEMEYEF